jgi:hypothetical protein
MNLILQLTTINKQTYNNNKNEMTYLSKAFTRLKQAPTSL